MVTLLGSILENAVCHLTVPIGGTTIDFITNNPIPITKNYDVYLYLQDGLKAPRRYEETQPRSIPMVWLEGYVTRVVDPSNPLLVFPAAMPDTNLTRVPCSFANEQIGSLYLIDRYNNAALEQYVPLSIIGEQVWGWWTEEGYNTDD